MNKEYEENLIVKATFEDCLNAQERLREKINELAKKNRCLTEGEREDFFRELAHSTYGLGITKAFRIFIENKIYTLGSVESVARWIASQDKNKLCIPGEFGNPPSPEIDISILWQRLLDLLYSVFPIALDRSSSMSKERDASTGGMGYDFNPNE